MTLNIQSPDISLTQETVDFLKRKLTLLTRRYPETLGMEATFRSERSATHENKRCELRLMVPGYDLLASSRGSTFEAAIAATSEALERQIEKRKTKILNAK